MRILLDTDVMIDILRGYPPAVEWLENLGSVKIGLPGFVAMELITGCQNKIQVNKIKRVIHDMPLFWPDPSDGNAAFDMYCFCKLTHNIGLIDCLIASVSLALDFPLYTFNVKHYKAITGLKTVQPYSKTKNPTP